MIAGVSTLGVQLGMAIETTAGTKPTAFTLLGRINSIGSISLSTENIDASALEDLVTRYVAGRQDSGGEWTITVNLTEETIAEWDKLITDSTTAYKAGKSTWFETYIPYMPNKAFFVVAQPPQKIPHPQIDQNGLLTVEMTLTINEYKGIDTAIVPTAPSAE